MKNRNDIITDFIEQGSARYAGKYSYRKVDYVSQDGKVVIVCPIHGDFSQTVVEHLKVGACSECSNIKRDPMIKVIPEDAHDFSNVVHKSDNG